MTTTSTVVPLRAPNHHDRMRTFALEDVACPYCDAIPGQPCRTVDKRAVRLHGSRREFARDVLLLEWARMLSTQEEYEAEFAGFVVEWTEVHR